MATFEIIKIAWLYNLIEIDFLPIRICPLDLDTRAFQTRPFRRTRTQTEVRNSDSDSDLRNRDFPTPLNKNQIQIIDTRHKASIWDIFGSDQTTGCPRNHMKTFSNIDYSHSMYLYENLSGKCITRPEFWNQVILQHSGCECTCSVKKKSFGGTFCFFKLSHNRVRYGKSSVSCLCILLNKLPILAQFF
jgi:hypothetical protein